MVTNEEGQEVPSAVSKGVGGGGLATDLVPVSTRTVRRGRVMWRVSRRSGWPVFVLALFALAMADCGWDEEITRDDGADVRTESTASNPPATAASPTETVVEGDDRSENEGLARRAERLLVVRLGPEARRIERVRPDKPTGDLIVVVKNLAKNDAPIATSICRELQEARNLPVDDVRTVGSFGQELIVDACKQDARAE